MKSVYDYAVASGVMPEAVGALFHPKTVVVDMREVTDFAIRTSLRVKAPWQELLLPDLRPMFGSMFFETKVPEGVYDVAREVDSQATRIDSVGFLLETYEEATIESALFGADHLSAGFRSVRNPHFVTRMHIFGTFDGSSRRKPVHLWSWIYAYSEDGIATPNTAITQGKGYLVGGASATNPVAPEELDNAKQSYHTFATWCMLACCALHDDRVSVEERDRPKGKAHAAEKYFKIRLGDAAGSWDSADNPIMSLTLERSNT